MTRIGCIALGLAILMGSVPALAQVTYGGYRCLRRADGAYGRVFANVYLDENGAVYDSNASWEIATPIVPVKVSEGITQMRQDTEMVLHFERERKSDLSEPLRPAWLYLQQIVRPLPADATYLFLTLADGRYVRANHISSSLIRKWQTSKASGFGSGVDISDTAFLDAFTRSPAVAIDIVQHDGVPASRTVLYVKDGALAMTELQRLNAKAIAASRNYRSECGRITIVE